MKFFTKKNIIIILSVILALLVCTDYLLIYKHNTFVYKHSSSYIKETFDKILPEYGLKKEWITEKQNADSNYTNYKILIPKDLAIPLIIQEISNALEDSTIKISVVEQGINGNSLMRISYFDTLKLRAEFVYDTTIVRNTDTLSFVLLEPSKLNKDELNELLNTPDPLDFSLIPTEKNKNFIENFKNSNKGYGIILNDDNDEVQYRFNKDYSQARLESSLRQILGDFPDSKFFVVDDKSDFYNSGQFEYVEKSFSKRNIQLFKLSSFKTISDDEDQAPVQLWNYIQSNKFNQNLVFNIKATNYLYLKDLIKRLKKSGFKFMKPPIY